MNNVLLISIDNGKGSKTISVTNSEKQILNEYKEKSPLKENMKRLIIK